MHLLGGYCSCAMGRDRIICSVAGVSSTPVDSLWPHCELSLRCSQTYAPVITDFKSELSQCQHCLRGLTMVQPVSPTTYLKQTNRLSTMTRQFVQLQSKHVGSKSSRTNEATVKEKGKRSVSGIYSQLLSVNSNTYRNTLVHRPPLHT